MLDRVLRVIKLDQTVFGEVEKDESATAEAFIIVLVTSFLSALGSGFASGRFFPSFIGTFIMGILGWVIWSVITLWVGTKLYNGQADLGEMLRTIGYANAPRLLGFFAWIPGPRLARQPGQTRPGKRACPGRTDAAIPGDDIPAGRGRTANRRHPPCTRNRSAPSSATT